MKKMLAVITLTAMLMTMALSTASAAIDFTGPKTSGQRLFIRPSYNLQVNTADKWTCSCGAENTGKFCSDCGEKRPAAPGSWTCGCGAENAGKFCPECGAQRPASAGWTCGCGAENTGKFCPECGAACLA
ncbi:MAG: hypothetical protein IJD60_00120 [Clostridia bacterium]|nr:hypothetical protein [Clostridia bacterium]